MRVRVGEGKCVCVNVVICSGIDATNDWPAVHFKPTYLHIVPNWWQQQSGSRRCRHHLGVGAVGWAPIALLEEGVTPESTISLALTGRHCLVLPARPLVLTLTFYHSCLSLFYMCINVEVQILSLYLSLFQCFLYSLISESLWSWYPNHRPP